MKKLFLTLLGGMVAALLTGAVLIWDATADAAMDVIMVNTRYIKRQIAFDYDKLIIGSHWLRPKITMTNPSLRFMTDQGQYRLVAAQVEFVGSFTSLGEYTIRLPEKFLLEKTAPQYAETLFQVKEYPQTDIRSSEPVEGKPAESIYLDNFRFEKRQPLVLQIVQDKQKPIELTFTPPEIITLKWWPIRYEVTPYLQRFVTTVEHAKR